MTWQLTQGALATLVRGGTVENPVMQILGSKNIAGTRLTERYRLLVSDGCHLYSFAVLAEYLNDKLTSGELSKYSVVRMNRLVTAMMNSGEGVKKCCMIIYDLTILAKGVEVGMKIGNPVYFVLKQSGSSAVAPPAQPATPTIMGVAAAMSRLQLNGKQPMRHQMRYQMRKNAAQLLSPTDGYICPVRSLCPYRNKWVIKAHVGKIGPVKTSSNARGETKPFSIKLENKSGEDATGDESDKMRSRESMVKEKEKLATGSLSEVRELLARGAEIDWMPPHCYESALHLAVAANHISNVSYLLRVGAKANARSQTRDTPLHYAAVHGRLEIFWLLVACGADINAQNDEGQTPLHKSLEHTDVLKALLQAGADKTIRDKSGRTPCDVAKLSNTDSSRYAVVLLE